MTMNRREFVTLGLPAAGAVLAGGLTPVWSAPSQPGKHSFKLKYAPHFGMFQHHAGKDLADQLKFMADQGFRAMSASSWRSQTPLLVAAG